VRFDPIGRSDVWTAKLLNHPDCFRGAGLHFSRKAYSNLRFHSDPGSHLEKDLGQ
jgi:hypothetical protein